jgi:uncharacterized protein involved in exopolysaccharide biosynthesis
MAKYDINIRDYWRIIRKRRTVVILSTILFTVFSYLFSVISTPEPLYEATSAVKVEKATDLTTLLLGTVSWTSWDNVATQAVNYHQLSSIRRILTTDRADPCKCLISPSAQYP